MEHEHNHPHIHEYEALDPAEAFQMLSHFLSAPSERAADDLRPFLPDIRNIAFYYRFMLDAESLGDPQLALVRQFIAQTYAAQEMIRRMGQE